MSIVYKGGGTVIKPGRGIQITSSQILEKKDLGLGVTMYVPKNKKNRGVFSTSARTGRDTGVGRRMSYAARKKFIKDKNPDYIVKETNPSGPPSQRATYGVRQIVE